ncbi:MAG: MBL fold metallo-hydrolase [Desulfobulbia bacterium]
MLCNHIQKKGFIRPKTKPLPGTKLVKPSIDKKFTPGDLIDHIPIGDPSEWTVQRLTNRDYWLFNMAYSITVHVGDESVLIIDCPTFMTTQGIVENVAKITPLPISTLVYTHHHIDHIGDTKYLIEIAKAENREIEIIGSEKCYSEIKRYREHCVLPTKVIPEGYQKFTFEDREFKMVTPSVWAHCGSDSYIITPEGVAQFDDFVYPGALPLANISNLENWDGYIHFLRCLAGDTWHLANLGHSNIGCKADVMRTLEYFEDIYQVGMAYYRENWNPATMVKAPQFMRKNAAVVLRMGMDMQAGAIAKKLYPKWGKTPHWEVARDHIEHVLTDIGMYYDFLDENATPVSFSPIAVPD